MGCSTTQNRAGALFCVVFASFFLTGIAIEDLVVDTATSSRRWDAARHRTERTTGAFHQRFQELVGLCRKLSRIVPSLFLLLKSKSRLLNLRDGSYHVQHRSVKAQR